VLSVSLASSPPFFDVVAGSEDDCWVTELCFLQFPAMRSVVRFGKLTRMCLASLLYHRRWIFDSLAVNHVVRFASYSLRNDDSIAKIESSSFLRVTYPWNDNEHFFGGIPPHVSLLQELMLLRSDQTNLITNFVDRVKEALSSYGVNSDRLTEQRLRAVLDEFQVGLASQIGQLDRLSRGADIDNSDRVETGGGYRLHFYGGKFHRVPVDWRFPRCGVQDLWRQWWIGDSVRQVPPLRFLTTTDVSHFDKTELDSTETHGRVGQNRRPSKKMMCDLRFLMRFVTELVKSKDAMETTITISAVDKMFLAVSEKFDVGTRDLQKQWLTVVRELRKNKTNN
jgi:hypothetical protein